VCGGAGGRAGGWVGGRASSNRPLRGAAWFSCRSMVAAVRRFRGVLVVHLLIRRCLRAGAQSEEANGVSLGFHAPCDHDARVRTLGYLSSVASTVSFLFCCDVALLIVCGDGEVYIVYWNYICCV